MELEELRSKEELVNYLKKFNIDITQEQIDYLKEKYNRKNYKDNNILSVEQLNNVAGGEIRIKKLSFFRELFTGRKFSVKYSPNLRDKGYYISQLAVQTGANKRQFHSPSEGPRTVFTEQFAEQNGANQKQYRQSQRLVQYNSNLPGVYYNDKFYLLGSLPEEARTALTAFAKQEWTNLNVHEEKKGDVAYLIEQVKKECSPSKTKQSEQAKTTVSEIQTLSEAYRANAGLYDTDYQSSGPVLVMPTQHKLEQEVTHHKVTEPISPIAKEIDADVVMLAALRQAKELKGDELFKFLAFEPENNSLRQYSVKTFDLNRCVYEYTREINAYTLVAEHEEDGLKMLFDKGKMLTSCLNRLHIPGVNVIEPSELSRMNLSFLISYLDERGEPTGVLKQHVDSLEVSQDLKNKIISKLSTIRFSINPQLNANDEVDQHILNFVSGITGNEQTRKIIEYNYKQILYVIKTRLLQEAGVSDKEDRKKFNVVYNNGKMEIVYKHGLTEVKSGKFDKLDDKTIEDIVKFIKKQLDNKSFFGNFFASLFSSAGKSAGSKIGKAVAGIVIAAISGSIGANYQQILNFFKNLFTSSSDDNKNDD